MLELFSYWGINKHITIAILHKILFEINNICFLKCNNNNILQTDGWGDGIF